MNVERALFVINEIEKGWHVIPKTYYKNKTEFIFQSYSRSALNEIKLYLMEHKNKDPISLVEDFRYLVDCFACITKNADVNFMFSTYYDMATYVLDILLSYQNNKF